MGINRNNVSTTVSKNASSLLQTNHSGQALNLKYKQLTQ